MSQLLSPYWRIGHGLSLDWKIGITVDWYHTHQLVEDLKWIGGLVHWHGIGVLAWNLEIDMGLVKDWHLICISENG